jgi:hypothetical protein
MQTCLPPVSLCFSWATSTREEGCLGEGGEEREGVKGERGRDRRSRDETVPLGSKTAVWKL